MEATIIQSQTQRIEATSTSPRDGVRIVSTPSTCGGRPRINGQSITTPQPIISWRSQEGYLWPASAETT